MSLNFLESTSALLSTITKIVTISPLSQLNNYQGPGNPFLNQITAIYYYLIIIKFSGFNIHGI